MGLSLFFGYTQGANMSASKSDPVKADEAEFLRALTELVTRSKEDSEIDLMELMETIVSIGSGVPRTLVTHGIH